MRKANSIRAGKWLARPMALSVAAMAATPALGGTSTVPANDTNSLRAGQTMPTISLTGSTAMKTWLISANGATLLTSGTSITLGDGSPSQPEIVYTAPQGIGVSYQLANPNLGNDTLVTGTVPDTVNQSALRLEYHESGSAEGVLELIDSQINNSIIADKTFYNPNSTQAVWVNTNKFGGSPTAGPFPQPGQPPVQSGSSGYFLGYQPSSLPRNPDAQNPAQMALSDVASIQTLAKSGGAGNVFATPNTPGYGKGNPALALQPLEKFAAGAAFQLPDQSLANMSAGATNPTFTANQPRTGPATYGTGAWNTAGPANLVDHVLAQTATNFVANPGTGLEHINRSDAQWLLTTGRLQNGASFQVTTRDVGSGTRNVSANNVGVDPSWAVGVNDAGNGNAPNGGDQQVSIGPNILYSNKTSGGAGLRPTVQNARMAIGTLSISDTGSAGLNNSSKPLRVLAYRDDANDINDGSNGANYKNWNEDPNTHAPVFTTGDLASHTFVQANATTITNGSYVLWQNETMVTVKVPDSTLYTKDVIKGDNGTTVTLNANGTDVGTGHDVRDFRDNILNADATVGVGQTSSVANPADELVANGYIVPKLMLVQKSVDGLNQASANSTYDSNYRSTVFLPSTVGNAAFNPDTPATVTDGGGTAFYGGSNTAGVNGVQAVQTPAGSSDRIHITDPNGASGDHSKGNWLFGNFNQNGIRDFNSLKTGEAALEALWNNSSDHSTSAFVGSAANNSLNSSTVTFNTTAHPNLAGLAGMTGQTSGTTGATKGDLIVMGDYAGHGTFDGSDLYQMAVGTALADNVGTDRLTLQKVSDGYQETFSDAARRGVLVKNGALDYLQQQTAGAVFDSSHNPMNAAAFVRQSASANLAVDPTGANAFNKFDVNHDGAENLNDAKIVDKFIGSNYTHMTDQLSATIANDGSISTAKPQTPFSLVMASLIDRNSNDTLYGLISRQDFNQIAADLEKSGKLVPGDVNLDGQVDNSDIAAVLANFGNVTDPNLSRWTSGDVTGDGQVDNSDLATVLNNFGSVAAADQVFNADHLSRYGVALEGGHFVAVPEPGTIGLIAAAGLLTLRRRRTARPC